MTTTNKETRAIDRTSESVSTPVARPNYEVRVGIFTLIAVLLLLYGWTWLKSVSIFHPPQIITVQFHDIAGLANNAPVNINGVRVGTVDQIDLKGKGQVFCTLRIKTEEVIVPQGSTFTIQTLGMVGAKYVEISLPEEKPGEQPPPPIDPHTIVIGQDPVRVELVINKIATNLNQMITRVASEDTQSSLVDALKHSGETIKNINEAATKLNKNMDKVAVATESFTTTSSKIGTVADQAKRVTSSANRFFDQGTGALNNISVFATDLRKTSSKFNRMLDNPALSADFRETASMVRETAATVQKTINDLNVTLQDKPLRQDLLTALERVNKSTEDIHKSIDVLGTLKDDQALRSDVKEVVSNAKDAMIKLDNIISDKGFKTDLQETVVKVKTAATNVDTVARQMNQVLNSRRPLWKMMTGSPGRLKEEKKPVPDKKKDSNEEIKQEQAPQP